METSTDKLTDVLTVKAVFRRHPTTRVSRGGLNEINPDDIIYGEYAGGDKNHGNWIDLVYLDDDILRTYSGSVSPPHSIIEELKVLLRDEDIFYLVPVKELPLGFAFKRMDIVDIKVTSTINGTANHVPSCVWKIHFKDGSTRTLEAEYQAYFAYGNIIRPTSMTNATILDNVFSENGKG